MFIEDREDSLEQLREESLGGFETSTPYEPGGIGEFIENSNDIPEDFDGNGDEHILAGRVTAIRDFGGICFLDIRESGDSIQVQFEESETDEHDSRSLLQVGDIIEVTGEAIRNGQQLTIRAFEYRVLSKALQHPPSEAVTEDVETNEDLSPEERLRNRGRTLEWDQELHESVDTRFRTVDAIREHLQGCGYREVDTPILHTQYGGGQAQPFESYANSIESNVYLRIAPELYLKRLIVGGFPQIFEIGSVFRNEDIDTTHHPEYTMLELYRAYSDLEEMMDLTEEILESTTTQVTGSSSITYNGVELDFESPYPREPIDSLIDTYGPFEDPLTTLDDDELIQEASQYEDVSTRGDAIMELYDEFVEDEIEQPTFVTQFPEESTPLCSDHPDVEDRIHRFELVVNGTELVNSYSEQTNPLEQREAFRAQMERYDEDDEAYQQVDEDFLEDLATGMPPTGGLGLGVDRLAMFYADADSIQDIIPFPLINH